MLTITHMVEHYLLPSNNHVPEISTWSTGDPHIAHLPRILRAEMSVDTVVADKVAELSARIMKSSPVETPKRQRKQETCHGVNIGTTVPPHGTLVVWLQVSEGISTATTVTIDGVAASEEFCIIQTEQ